MSAIRKAKESFGLAPAKTSRAEYFSVGESGVQKLDKAKRLLGARFCEQGLHNELILENLACPDSETSVLTVDRFEGRISALVVLKGGSEFLAADTRGRVGLYEFHSEAPFTQLRFHIADLGVGGIFSATAFGKTVILGGAEQVRVLFLEKESMSAPEPLRLAELASLEAGVFEGVDQEKARVEKEGLLVAGEPREKGGTGYLFFHMGEYLRGGAEGTEGLSPLLGGAQLPCAQSKNKTDKYRKKAREQKAVIKEMKKEKEDSCKRIEELEQKLKRAQNFPEMRQKLTQVLQSNLRLER